MRVLLRHILRLAPALLLAATALFTPAAPAGAAITLAEISATAQPDGTIRVRWVTATESNSSQFILYRSALPDGPWENEVNRQDAQDLSGLVGATYVYTDADVVPGAKYYYVLGELEKTGNLVKYTDARREAIAGQVPSETATPTRTATPTPALTPAPQPTATRQFTNTPRPTATTTVPPAGALATATAARPGTATPLPGATISSPGGVQPGITPGAPAPEITAAPTDALPAAVTGAAPAPVTAAPAITAASPPAKTTATPQIFEPAGVDQPLLGASTRPAARPTPAPAAQAVRNSRLILILGGLAVGLAALLGGTAFFVWRGRQR